MKIGFHSKVFCAALVLLLGTLLAPQVMAVDVITNGAFDSDISDWMQGIEVGNGSVSWDGSVYGVASGSMKLVTNTGNRQEFRGRDSIYISQVINQSDPVTLSFYWYKTATADVADRSEVEIFATEAETGVEQSLWSDDSGPNAGQVLDGNVTSISVANAFPTTSVNPIGANTTTISTVFTDVDQPGVGAYTVLVNALTNGNTGLTITDGGGGSDTVSYTLDPGDAQNTETYDLYFEVSDDSGSAIDASADNGDELTIARVAPNSVPTVVAGATGVSPASINRVGANSTVVSTQFTDIDQPGVGVFTVTFKVKDNVESETVLVNALTNGAGGLTITDGGGGSYTATYSWDPGSGQTLGFYDLYFFVSDGTDNVTDDYTSNVDELEIDEVIVNSVPSVTPGATVVSASPVNRLGTSTTIISTSFYDADAPGVSAFNVTFKIREKDNITELTLVNNQPNGGGGLTIIDHGSGIYTASYTYDPSDVQDTGLYDLYFEVSDGSDNVIDSYASNDNELEISEVIANATPTITAGNTSVSPSSLDRVGAVTTQFSVTFDDTDEPGIAEFSVTFMVQAPYSEFHQTVADSLKHGVGGMSITDNGGGSYTATFDWDPADNQMLGYYDLRCEVADAHIEGTDSYVSNTDELLITNGGENIPPVVPGDAVFATPAGVERIGANPTTLSATFIDGDVPGVNAFDVTFKLRLPNDITEIVLADNVGNGSGGVTINDDGGGIYTASISWDPGDAQSLGYYDLYFHVTDGADTTYDVFQNNLDELQLYDAISNNAPTLTAGATFPLPTSVNRIGTGFAMLKSTFTDIDEPGLGAFTITFKTRDLASGEVTVVNAAKHGEQGLRVVALGSGSYEAAVLWDPDVAEPTGGHDLYFSVTDNNGATTIDDYASNNDELNVTSAAILGDGHLLKRGNDAATCGGPNDACHNMVDHQSQDCRVCHTPHGSSNIYLVRETITTPNSGDMPVIFKTLGIGDPFNDPDPTVGDPNSGVMADSTDGVFTGVCEVCHTQTNHHRNDGSHPLPAHNDAVDCTSCHPHTEGFAVSGGGESSGGSNCFCHSSIFSTMDSTAPGYHHILANDNADYSPGASGMYTIKNCLTCHVDHDIFRPDLNTGIGQRARNLRIAWDVDPVQGNSSHLHNSDYTSSGSGGICLSCHGDILLCNGCHSAHAPDLKPRDLPKAAASTFDHVSISKTDFDAATSAHNYNVPTTFSTDGSTFNGNCVKCHNDVMTKSYQGASPSFGVHGSDYNNILDSAGVSGPVDPLEEEFCFKCHSTTSNPNAGSNLDYFGVKTMSTSALDIEAAFSRTYTHPTATYRGRHSRADSALSFADGNRHAECVDCHDTHAARQGTHDGTSSLVSNALKGTWGVKPTSWPAAPTPSDNANVFAAPAGFTKVSDNTLEEWMICMKCHSNYTTLPSGKRNLAAEINPNYPSTHGITIANQNSYCNTTTMNAPWGSSGRTWCSDCHRSDNPADSEGPHGSNQEHLLVATVVSDDINGTPLCLVCHKSSSYWTADNGSRYTEHPGSKDKHMLPQGCFACHMWEFSSTAGLGVPTTDWSGGNPPVGLLVHGMNKKWVYDEMDGSGGTGQANDAFVSGYVANMDFSGTRCWSDVCKDHSDKGY